MKSGCRSCALAAASSSALGISRRKITHTFTSIWAMPVRSSAPIALRYSVSIRAWAHTKPIRQIVLTVTWTELKSSNAASFVIPAAAAPAPGAIVPQSRGGSRWPRTIRIRQDASVTTAEPAIAVARDQVIDRVADHPWDELEDPCPLPTRKLARNAQHGFGFYIGLAVRHRTQRNPGDQDRCRAAQRADVPRPTGSERSENSRGDHVCSRSGSRASIGRIRRRTGSGRAAS